MKIEIGKDFPQYFKPSYPEEFELFSHFETTAGIPTVLFAITTWKENEKPNVCFHSWSCFHGDKTAFFAVMTAMVIGQVQHISVDGKYAQGYKQRYGKDGFMMLIPAPQDLVTGEPNQSAIATVNIEKYD